MGTKPTKILVMCLAGAGDVLMATPMIRELRNAYPAARLDVLVMQGAVARDILAGNPCVNEAMLFNFMAASKLQSLKFCLKLRRRRYDLLIAPMPQNRLEYNLIAWLTGASERVGFEYAVKSWTGRRLLLTRWTHEKEDRHVVENDLRLLSEVLGLPLSEGRRRLELFIGDEHARFAREFLAERNLTGQFILGFHPGSGTTKNLALRRWAPEKWATLARMCIDRFPGAGILLFGADAERSLREEIISASGLSGNSLMTAEAPGILESAALIRGMRCFVCCDTLLTHIAAAVGTPTVEILGPTDPRSIYPYGVKSRIVRAGLECSPCYRYSRQGIRCTNPVFLKCLKDVTPEMVLAALTDIMAT